MFDVDDLIAGARCPREVQNAQSNLRRAIALIQSSDGTASAADLRSITKLLTGHLDFGRSMLSESNFTDVQRNFLTGTFPSVNAAKCISDFPRTWRFVRAITDGVKAREAVYSGKEMHVLDAGCGPVVFLGNVAAIQSNNIRVTAVEGSEASAEMARQSIAYFGLEDRVSVVVADARKYIPRKKYDIIITETFDNGMAEEKAFDILRQSTKYLVDGGLVIPQQIVVKAALVPESEYDSHFRTSPDNALNWVTAHTAGVVHGEDSFDGYIECSIAAPKTLAAGRYVVVLTTDLEFSSGNYALSWPTFSAITYPRKIANLKLNIPLDADAEIRIQYMAGDMPSGVQLGYPKAFVPY